jgi:hypothetical protein
MLDLHCVLDVLDYAIVITLLKTHDLGVSLAITAREIEPQICQMRKDALKNFLSQAHAVR